MVKNNIKHREVIDAIKKVKEEMELGIKKVEKDFLRFTMAYVEVKNAKTLYDLITWGAVVSDGWEIVTGETDEVREDIKTKDGWLITTVKVDNLTIDGNPGIKKGLRVYVHDSQGNKREEALYLTVSEDGSIGRDDVEFKVLDESEVIKKAYGEAIYYLGFTGFGRDRSYEVVEYYASLRLDRGLSYDAAYKNAIEWAVLRLQNKKQWVESLMNNKNKEAV